MMNLTKQGTIGFHLSHDHTNWATNADTYIFLPVSQSGIHVSSVKHSDGTIETNVDGPFGRYFTFRAPIPKSEHPVTLVVAITWKRSEVNFYLNGKLAEMIRLYM
jgi:hypothetical protein